MKQTNYSFETSLPAYKINPVNKQSQANKILGYVKQLKSTTLKELEDLTGMPQSTIAGRVNDLIEDKKVHYNGKKKYKGMLRKIIEPVPEITRDIKFLF